MRLGLWNRLAIVASALTMVGGATWGVLDQWTDATSAEQSLYDICMRRANEALRSGDSATNMKIYNQCWKERFDTPHYRAGWGEWFQGLLIMGLLCGLTYGLIWVVVWTARWIWRGRDVKNTETA